MQFADLGLRAALIRAVHERGHTVPTAVQARVIPAILSGRDVTQIARRGSGKTAAYALPLLQRLLGARAVTARAARALVLVESRRAALHVAAEVRRYGAHLPFGCAAAHDDAGVPQREVASRSRGDILVATPEDVLIEHHGRPSDLSEIEIIVLDDADRILDRHSHARIRRLFSSVPGQRQIVLFTASSSSDVEMALGRFGRDADRFAGARPRRLRARMHDRGRVSAPGGGTSDGPCLRSTG